SWLSLDEILKPPLSGLASTSSIRSPSRHVENLFVLETPRAPVCVCFACRGSRPILLLGCQLLNCFDLCNRLSRVNVGSSAAKKKVCRLLREKVCRLSASSKVCPLLRQFVNGSGMPLRMKW
ncbi:unnamed protein product, partial [Ixodes pacificus]